MLGERAALIEGHDDELRRFRAGDVAIHDFAVLIGHEIDQREDLVSIDAVADRSVFADRYLCIDRVGIGGYADGFVGGFDNGLARADMELFSRFVGIGERRGAGERELKRCNRIALRAYRSALGEGEAYGVGHHLMRDRAVLDGRIVVRERKNMTCCFVSHSKHLLYRRPFVHIKRFAKSP